MTCIVFFILVALLAVAVLMIILSYYATGYLNSPRSKNVDCGPGDTKKLFFSAIFCEELSTDSSSLYHEGYQDFGLYLLNTPPSLSGSEEVKFGATIIKPYQRNFHLFKGSTVTVKACLEKSDNYGIGNFYLVKGKSTWEDAYGSIDESTSVDFLTITSACYTDEQSESVTYTVVEEDQYFLYFFNGNNASGEAAAVTVKATINIQRMLYNFTERSVITSCKFNTEPCSLSLPFQTSTSVLLTYGRPDSWESSWSNSSISISCHPRFWFYAVLVLIGVLVIVLSTCAGCLACWCCSSSLYEKDAAEAPLLNARTGNLYSDTVPVSKEMHNPFKYGKDSRQEAASFGELPVSTTKSQVPVDYRPPSFKDDSYGEMGTPSYNTFTRK